jgi:hypothetical protein
MIVTKPGAYLCLLVSLEIQNMHPSEPSFFFLSRAFPLLPLCWAIGLMIGPAIGGYTAEPAKQYPHSIFARHPFFSTYPYFVPCLLAGLFNILAVVLGTLYLEEVCAIILLN